jgi:hypothetical protein
MPLVKLTLFPDPIEVPDDELPVLRAQGLVEDPAETPAKAAKVAAPRKDEL